MAVFCGFFLLQRRKLGPAYHFQSDARAGSGEEIGECAPAYQLQPIARALGSGSGQKKGEGRSPPQLVDLAAGQPCVPNPS